MGNGITRNTSPSKTRGPQEDGMSYKGKIGGMKMIINSDGSKSALLKYLESKGHSCLLLYYIELDELKRGSRDMLFSRINDIKHKYDPENVKTPWNSSQEEVWNTVKDTFVSEKGSSFNTTEIMKNVKQSQELIFIVISKLLDDFLISDYYLEWQKTDSDQAIDHHMKLKIENPIYQNLINKYQGILLIDDTPIHSKMMTTKLEHLGHRVRSANHGRIGLEIITLNTFGIIFIHMNIKTMDPYNVAKKMKIWEKEMIELKSHETQPLHIIPINNLSKQHSMMKTYGSMLIIGLVDNNTSLSTMSTLTEGNTVIPSMHTTTRTTTTTTTSRSHAISKHSSDRTSTTSVKDYIDYYLPYQFIPQQLYECLETHDIIVNKTIMTARSTHISTTIPTSSSSTATAAITSQFNENENVAI